MAKKIRIAVMAGGGLAVLFALVFIMAITVYGIPPRVLTSVFWSPPPVEPNRGTVVIVEMGSDESFPLLWKSVGSFVEETADVNIIVLHYRSARTGEIMKHAPKAVVLTGYHQELSTYDFRELESLFDFLRRAQVPVLGICGGHQFLCMAYGSKITGPDLEEKGFIPVSPVQGDPLFRNTPSKPTVFLWHKLKAGSLPADFVLLARNDACIQAVRHKSRTIYGVQFHPEYSSGAHPDGIAVFKNFLAAAGIKAR
jgi:GMP synthase (glutamine-hydrolysing)